MRAVAHHHMPDAGHLSLGDGETHGADARDAARRAMGVDEREGRRLLDHLPGRGRIDHAGRDAVRVGREAADALPLPRMEAQLGIEKRMRGKLGSPGVEAHGRERVPREAAEVLRRHADHRNVGRWHGAPVRRATATRLVLDCP